MNYYCKSFSYLSVFFIFCVSEVGYAYINCNQFLGKWCWDKNNEHQFFSIHISKKQGNYAGGYDTVMYGGSKIDDNANAFKFKICEKDGVIARITSASEKKIGLIQLKMLDNKIHWSILKRPAGDEFYAPEKAKLIKCKR